jgi:exoribonuclease II
MDSVYIFKLYDIHSTGKMSSTQVNEFLLNINSELRVNTIYTLNTFIELVDQITEKGNTVIESFIRLDKDSDGCISIQDLKSSILACGVKVNDDELTFLHNKIDLNGSGCPCFIEYSKAVTYSRLKV